MTPVNAPPVLAGPADLVLTVGTSPEPVLPELREGLDPDDVTPGLLGFLVIFVAVLACIPLFLSMTGKLRRMQRRADAERAAGARGPGSALPGDDVVPGGDAAPDGSPQDGSPDPPARGWGD